MLQSCEKAAAMSFVFYDFMVRFDSLFTALFFVERIWTCRLPFPGFGESFLIKEKNHLPICCDRRIVFSRKIRWTKGFFCIQKDCSPRGAKTPKDHSPFLLCVFVCFILPALIRRSKWQIYACLLTQTSTLYPPSQMFRSLSGI